MDGNFPGLSSAVPAAVSHRVQIGRQALIDALDAAIVVESWYSSDEQIVKCEVRPTYLIVSARSGEQGTARARVPAKTEGNPYAVLLNGIHLRQSLREFDTPEIELSFAANDTRGVIVRAQGEPSESLAVLVRSRLEE